MTDAYGLQPLDRKATLVERVVDQIQDLTMSGGFAPGHRLPSERQLGETLGVSRTVVREALSALSAKGIVESMPGGGFAISTPKSRMVAQSLTLFLRAGQPHLDYDKVHEVRELLEVKIAELAADHRTPAELALLEASVCRLKEAGSNRDVQAFVEADVEFHAILAQASHNPLLWLMIETISDVMRDVRLIGSNVQGTFSRAVRHHQRILQAVVAMDGAAAKEAMALHLQESYKTVEAGMKKLKQQEKK